MPPFRLTALAIFALTVGLWVGLGDGSAWRTAAVVLGGALIGWALLRRGAAEGAVERDVVGGPTPALRVTGRARIGSTRRGHHDRAARTPREIRCDASGGPRGHRHPALRRVRS